MWLKMKVIIVLAALISLALAVPTCFLEEEDLMLLDIGPNMTYFLVPHEEIEGAYVIEDLESVEIEALATSDSDLTYYFYSKNNLNDVAFKSDNLDGLVDTEFNITKDTLLIIHGWRNSYKSDINVIIKNAVLPKYDINVFVVDWSAIAFKIYVSAKRAVPTVGQYVANFLRSLQTQFGLQLSKVSVVGHSLGAHVAGVAGSGVYGAIRLIVGLDPALPLFSLGDAGNRLDPTDAQFVHVIHTCGGMLGFAAPIGHSDYYPNGGSKQPGCGWDISGMCAHSRAYHYYGESIALPELFSANSFAAKQCSNYKDYTNGYCNNNHQSNMGGYQIDTGAKGNYYLTTNEKPPYAQG